jgi:hypothetical protein
MDNKKETIEYKSEDIIIIEENYKKLYVLYKTYRNLKQINGKLINVLRKRKEYEVFHNINENLIERTKSEEPVLKIEEQNAVIKQEKDWFLGNAIIFYNQRIDWYQKQMQFMKALNERLNHRINCNSNSYFCFYFNN